MQVEVEVKPPYNFNLSMDFMYIMRNEPFPCIWDGKCLRRAFDIHGKILPVSITCVGSVDEPKIIIEVPNCKDHEIEIVREKVIFLLNLDYPLENLYKFMTSDDALKPLINRFYGFKFPRMGLSVYEGLIKAIIQQQISLKVAYRITSNLVKKFGKHVRYNDITFYNFPTAKDLANTKVYDLKTIGLSRNKCEYIVNVSKLVAGGNLNNIWRLEDEDVLETLISIKGIGRWTAQLVMATIMGKDIVPSDDLGVRKVISKTYFGGILQDGKTVAKFVQKKWKKYSSWIVAYLLYADRCQQL
jgi:DNA-3-methyladenine glycosylase II